jgi:hypothetical protein
MKTLVGIIYGLTVGAMAILWLVEHKACAQIHQENTELLRRLDEATEKLAENQRSRGSMAPASEPVPDASGAPLAGAAAADEELQRLHTELTGLLQAHQQAESLREDSRQARETLENRKKEDRAARRAARGNASALQIIKAEYSTDNASMDLMDELQDRVRGDSLKAVANNNLGGDPEYGQVKHLTIEYSIGGVIRTNQFREGDIVVLPAQ